MAEYIEREAALNICQKEYEERLEMCDYCGDTVAWNIGGQIKELPAADVAEVKHGKWIEVQKENIWNDIVPVLECSACGKYTVGTRGIMTKSNYCPNCGAKMDLED